MAITQVGATVTGVMNNGGNVTLTLPTSLEGDVVFLIGGTSSAHGGDHAAILATTGPSTAGYTEIIKDHTDSTPGVADDDWAAIGAWYKVMGATPDTAVTGTGNGNSANATVYHAIVLRGVDLTAPLDAVSAISRPGGTGPPDPPAVTVATVGAWVFACGGYSASDATATGPAGYSGFVWTSRTDTNSMACGFGYKEATTTGSEDPGAFSGLDLRYHPGAFTFAIKPAGGSAPPSEGSASGTLAWSGSATGSTARNGTASGNVAWSGSATGKRIANGTAGGNLAWTAAATGTRTPKATATGSLTWAGSAAGSAPEVGGASGSATGSLAWAGTATGKRTPHGSSAGILAWTGSATGTAPTVDDASGSAVGLLTWTGAATGKRSPTGSSVGTLAYAGTATGVTARTGSVVGELAWTGAATGIFGMAVVLVLTATDAPAAHNALTTPAAHTATDTPHAHTATTAPAAHTVRNARWRP